MEGQNKPDPKLIDSTWKELIERTNSRAEESILNNPSLTEAEIKREMDLRKAFQESAERVRKRDASLKHEEKAKSSTTQTRVSSRFK